MNEAALLAGLILRSKLQKQRSSAAAAARKSNHRTIQSCNGRLM
jgi:hypothetical protein